jgi:hypothetical protein
MKTSVWESVAAHKMRRHSGKVDTFLVRSVHNSEEIFGVVNDEFSLLHFIPEINREKVYESVTGLSWTYKITDPSKTVIPVSPLRLDGPARMSRGDFHLSYTWDEEEASTPYLVYVDSGKHVGEKYANGVGVKVVVVQAATKFVDGEEFYYFPVDVNQRITDALAEQTTYVDVSPQLAVVYKDDLSNTTVTVEFTSINSYGDPVPLRGVNWGVKVKDIVNDLFPSEMPEHAQEEDGIFLHPDGRLFEGDVIGWKEITDGAEWDLLPCGTYTRTVWTNIQDSLYQGVRVINGELVEYEARLPSSIPLDEVDCLLSMRCRHKYLKRRVAHERFLRSKGDLRKSLKDHPEWEVTTKDSLAVGNCEFGTEQFVLENGLGDSVKFSEIKDAWLKNQAFVAALEAAVSRQSGIEVAA